MGVRFDYGARRATNGPMIFFSDPVSEVNLKEEIRGAIDSQLSFYAYRMPGDILFSFGSSEEIVDGIGIPGFVIAPFNPDATPLTIPYRPTGNHSTRNARSSYSFPARSTTPEEHASEIEEIQAMLAGVGHGKVVAAKVTVEEGCVDLGGTFLQLSRNYPDAFIYCFGSPATGCWIGASPELLLSGSEKHLDTMALAGTRRIDDAAGWDEKNIDEQRIVTDYILERLENAGLQPIEGETFSKPAGKIEHLCTPISASPISHNLSGVSDQSGESVLINLLRNLSPTPALCGMPRDKALDVITKSEKFSRSFYGGYCGPFHSHEDFSFFVTIRCAQVTENRFAIYAGGGITPLSHPGMEWAEAELKTSAIRTFLEFQ